LDDTVLRHITAAAVKADAAEDEHDKSLLLLATSASTAVTRCAIIERLSAANAHLEAADLSDDDELPVKQLSGSDLVTWTARGRVFLARLARLAESDFQQRLDALLVTGDVAAVHMLCGQVVEMEDSQYGAPASAIRRVKNEIARRLGALKPESAFRVVWSLEPAMMCRLCEQDFGIFQGYMMHLLARLRAVIQVLRTLDDQTIALAAVMQVSPQRQRGAIIETPTVDEDKGDKVDDAEKKKKEEEELHSNATAWIVSLDDREIECVMKDVERRLEMLLLRCG
jgi:hypothetical protein